MASADCKAPRGGVPEAAPGAALDLHEELCDPGTSECSRWPLTLRLRSSHGELVMGRCGSTNLCAYCARLAAVENSEMLALDALDGDAPLLLAVLTTRTATEDMAVFYRARAQAMRALKRRWPGVQYASQLEYTTGYGQWSGGERRPHWNILLKGIPVSENASAREALVRVWTARVDATAAAQYVEPVGEAQHVLRYISLHFQKCSQAPPEGFRGQRFNCSRGYFGALTRAQARSRAKDSLAHKRELWRAVQRGEGAHDAELTAYQAMRRRASTTWVLTNERGARVSGACELRGSLVDRMRWQMWKNANLRRQYAWGSTVRWRWLRRDSVRPPAGQRAAGVYVRRLRV